MGKYFRNHPRVELSASHFRRRPPRPFHLFQNHVLDDENGWPCRDDIAAHPAFALPSTTANQKLEIPFPHRPADRTFSMRPGLFPSPLQFHSTSARPAARIYFPPMLSNTTSPPSREVGRRARFSHRSHAFQLRERFHGAFLRRQFHGLAIFGLALPPDGRQLAGLEIGMPFQNPQRIATRNRSVLAGVAGQNDSRIARANQTAASCRPSPPPRLHPARPTCRSDRAGLDSSRLCSVFASNPSLRKTSVAAAVGAQNSGSIFASLQAATSSRNAVVLPLPARPRRPVMRSLVRRT